MSDPARIEFPCDYPIHVIGERQASFQEDVLHIVRRHAPALNESSVSLRESREGSYCSLRVTIVATGSAQLEALHAELIAHAAVRMVL